MSSHLSNKIVANDPEKYVMPPGKSLNDVPVDKQLVSDSVVTSLTNSDYYNSLLTCSYIAPSVFQSRGLFFFIPMYVSNKP